MVDGLADLLVDSSVESLAGDLVERMVVWKEQRLVDKKVDLKVAKMAGM